MIIKTFRYVLMAMAIVAMLASCKGKKAKVAETIDLSKEETFESIANYPIPTSFEVLQLINRAGAGYIVSMCNSTENIGQYLTEKQKALNLGVYGADLAYATVYQMTQELMNYLEVSKKLIEDLNINIGFNRELAQNVENNINNKDSLINIITNSYFDTYKYLNNSGRDNLSLMVLAGSWVEGLYITSEITYTSRDNTDFLSIMAGQKASLGIIMGLLNDHKEGNADLVELANLLAPISEAYTNVADDATTLTDQQLDAIADAVGKVRQAMI